MNNKNDLKSQNKKAIMVFTLLETILYWAFVSGYEVTLKSIENDMSEALDSVPLALSLWLIIIILSGFIGNPIKEFLVFHRFINRLPGCRAFTQIALNDFRIDIEEIKKSLGVLPTEPKEQNSTWYRLYKRISDEPVIQSVHRNFLLLRELTWVSFFSIFGFGGAAYYYNGFTEPTHWYVLLLSIVYMLISISARNLGNRFVATVLARSI